MRSRYRSWATTDSRLFDIRMHDGSRHFGDLPETHGLDPAEWDRLRDAVSTLPGARLAAFTCDQVTEAWIEFELRGQALSINNQHGSWWFFVQDPTCPDDVLTLVLDHFESVLCPQVALARRSGPVGVGGFRVLVHEADARVSSRDFAALPEAQQYADDAASESESGVVCAYIFDDRLRLVGRGKHY